MNKEIDNLLRGWWPWVIAGLGVYLLLTDPVRTSEDSIFYGGLIAFPFTVAGQRYANRKEAEKNGG
jgi:hypothetical protein